MNWQQDEPKVMDEEMLKKAIEEQGPQGQAGDISKKEGIQYEDVLQLRLDYRSMNITDHFTPKQLYHFIKLIQFIFNIHLWIFIHLSLSIFHPKIKRILYIYLFFFFTLH